MQNAEQKELRTFRRGKINSRSEVRRQLRFRTNYEKFIYSRIATLFRQHIYSSSLMFEDTGVFDKDISGRDLYQSMSPLLVSFLRRMFIQTYKYYEEEYAGGRKAAEAELFVFGKLIDIEELVNNYFRSRELVLANIPRNIALKIDRIIQQGREENLTLPKISKNIRDYVIPISRSRAAMIARTETHNAASFASHNYHNTVRKDLGINMYKQWVSTNDGRTRSFHADANGQRVHMDEKFNVGGAEMDFTGDPAGGAKNVINCRCVIIYADERDIVLP